MAGSGSHGFETLASENLRQVMDFLSIREQFALLSSSKGLLNREPLAPVVVSYCGQCEACQGKTEHLCNQRFKHESKSFWTAMFKYAMPTGLTELRLASCDGFDASVLKSEGAKAALEPLKVLELNRCTSMGAEALGLLADMCGNLKELRFRDMALDRVALKKLLRKNAATLRVVDLLGCHTVKGEDVREVAQCTQLQDLSLWGCHNVDNASIVHVVQQCSRLERLNLRYAHKVDDKVVAAIASNLPLLKDLNLRYCYKVSDKGVKSLCESLPGLRSLNLSQCSRLTDASIMQVAASMPRLKELRLWGCTKLTSDSVFFISEGLLELTLLDLRSRDKLEAVIGGPTALKFLIQTYRSKLARWEQAQGEQAGVFKRHAMVAAAA
ncbi:F-box/LRR-repeat protein 14 [Phytophthora citrophthora]|uniref:F-box/LRR-repeat protein 14 n=1 Tax=Phytophthora citrophthora TaxID=4793 RepID=A0AAD9LSP6_9STRA|nr:F-box/LRR-repeat protein 14 [Phytophthora citrophthora]